MEEIALPDFPLDWEHAFPRQYVRRGRDYHRMGMVLGCRVDVAAHVLVAKVLGSAPEPYDVSVQWDSEKGQGDCLATACTCPVGAFCKHVAAVIIAALEGGPNVSVSNSPSSKKVLAAPVQSWLEQLQHAAAPPPPQTGTEAPDAEETERLAYVLNLEKVASSKTAQGTQLTVKPQIVRKLAAGGYGGAEHVYLNSDINEFPRPAYLRVEDVAIWRRVQLLQPPGFYYADCVLQGEEGAALLEEMLRSGHCHWKGAGKKHPPLTLAAPRLARLSWFADPQGMQSPTFEISPQPTAILPVTPPWYLDEKTATCGPLDTGLPPAVADAWFNAPTLTPDQAELVNEELTRRFPELRIPTPRRIEIETITDLKPVACLRLFSRRVTQQNYGYHYGRVRGLETMDLNLARLEFDYGGTRVDPHAPQAMLESFHENKLRRIRRDHRLENAHSMRLVEQGFQEARQLFFNYRLRKQGDALTMPDADAWFHFCQNEVPRLRAAGWRVDIDESFCFRLAEPEDWYANAEGSGIDWFGVEIGVYLDGQKLNLMPILLQQIQRNPQWISEEGLAALAEDVKLPVQLPDGRLLPFPVRRLKEMLGVLLELFDPKALDPRGRLHLSRLRAAELSAITGNAAEWRWLGGDELRELSRKLRDFAGIKPVTPSANLQAVLRGYQQEGLNWLQFLREFELGGILADDMGLGKTVQALAHLLMEREGGRCDVPSLVVAPTSLMTNWRQEAERFAPGLKVLVLHGLDRKAHFERIKDHDLVITSYPLLPRDQQILLGERFHYLILDEAQFIKNPKTKYAQIVCQLKARHRLCLTGTPMENHLGELWSLFNFLLPGFLGDETSFRRVFRNPIEKGQNEERRKILAHRVAPFVLRRRKEEVARELPPKTEIVQQVELAGAQRDLYETIRLAMHARVREEVGKKGLSHAHIVILDALLKLRQACCDPRLLKLDSARQVPDSAKLQLLMELLPQMIAEGRRVLLFSQFTSMLALIEPELDRAKIPYALLTGQTADRATPIRRFQQGEVPLFLISLKAGGTGLNLTAADTVIHYDPWWNPAVENQATDRAHRIGQEKPVFVYKLLTIGTVEEKILDLQRRKKELVEGLLDEDRQESVKLSAEDLDVLFAPIG